MILSRYITNQEISVKKPVWFMRQAGRYLPEYQKIRKNYSNFLDMCKQPKTCAELAMQPIERFDLDASILLLCCVCEITCVGVNFGLAGAGGVPWGGLYLVVATL